MKNRWVRYGIYVLFVEGVDKLGKDFVGHNFFSKVIRVTSKSSEGKSSALLDALYIIKEKRSQEGHHSC